MRYKYALSKGLFIYHTGGVWWEHTTGVLTNGAKYVEIWRLPDGIISPINPHPDGKFRHEVGKYVRDKSGTVVIKGVYPFYITDQGVPVYLDYDGSFSTSWVDFPKRVRERESIYRDNTIIRKKKKSGMPPTLRVKVKATVNEYRWAIHRVGSKAGEIAYGYALTRIRAEVDAKNWVINYKAKRVRMMPKEPPLEPDPSWFVDGDALFRKKS